MQNWTVDSSIVIPGRRYTDMELPASDTQVLQQHCNFDLVSGKFSVMQKKLFRVLTALNAKMIYAICWP
jgi:hypothetical protein